MKYLILSIAIVCSLTLAGCPRPIHEVNTHYEYQGQQVASPATPASATSQASDKPDWVNQKIQETGQGAAPAKYAAEPARARLMAKRAAIMDARRNLLERILGLRLDSKTTVRDMVAETDQMNAETSGFIRDSHVIGEHYEDGVYTVNMELKLYSVYTYLKTNKIYYK